MTDQSTNQRDKMLERIINLRNRAENGGSTEAEAMTSLAMAAKLMDSYHVEEAELALAESEGRITIDVITEVADTSCMNGGNRHRIIQTFWAVQNFTNTHIVYRANRGYYGGGVDITGDKPDVEIANYLLAIIRKAMDDGYKQYKKETVGVGRGAKAAFQQAMASRISQRLANMKKQADKDRQDAADGVPQNTLKIADEKIDSSTALVMIDIEKQKAKQINEAIKSKYGSRLGHGKGFGRTNNGTAHGAGTKAGDRVNLGKAINGASKKRIAA